MIYDSVLNDIERMQEEIANAISQIPEQTTENSDSFHITIPLTLNEFDTSEFIEEFKKLYTDD